ncbi:MAG: iron chelate uptake ABC transporter family permease subunit [Proteobacteria bacterium]|nr:iron chelate uptake ABC transporter family permease subunit [Pseudomonadota bacterium]
MLDDFLVRAGLAGIGLALAAGPLGCFVIWRRMAYFGDATAHAAILGVALSLTFSLSIYVGVLATALLAAFAVLALSGRIYAMDTLLGVAAHGALALGLVAVSLLSGVRVDLMAYLFGDILAVSRTDLVLVWTGSLAVLLLLRLRWRALLLVTLNTDLAAARGYDARREQMILTAAMAVLVAVAIKIVGALLITAILIIPAAAARALSRTPESMAVTAALTGICAVIGGLAVSFQWDTPTGPTMVVVAVALFALSSLVPAVSRGR